MSESAKCPRCGRHQFWADSVNKKKMPLDSTPSRTGKLYKLEDRPGENPLATFVKPEDHASEPKLYTCHLETCPKPRVPPARP
jgi:hypothetical protein